VEDTMELGTTLELAIALELKLGGSGQRGIVPIRLRKISMIPDPGDLIAEVP
jgi:hypothetical protein